jgi:hypothetical protein
LIGLCPDCRKYPNGSYVDGPLASVFISAVNGYIGSIS